ncbi:hypothetical protein IF1G_03156 [Cordyceps javanica]|uniref:Uncharacterized protein n=1 Tax=Cordyceps javanica TaxID=43265 RepID=A0A545V6T4_9HYPO|nr:hypothetical protein IF1G_03156 [Cordyceps javanica]
MISGAKSSDEALVVSCLCCSLCARPVMRQMTPWDSALHLTKWNRPRTMPSFTQA